MNLGYRTFGQGLTARGDTRPSITTAGAWGANYNPSDLAQRSFLLKKDMTSTLFPTAIGLSTEQKAYNNLINAGNDRSAFNAGLTGTGGLFRTGGLLDAIKKTKWPAKLCVVRPNSHYHPSNIDKWKAGKFKIPTTGGLHKKNKTKKRNHKRRTGGAYLDIRKAINKASTAGFHKQKKKGGKRRGRKK